MIRAEISKTVAALIKPLEAAIVAKPDVARAAAPAIESKTVREVFGVDLLNAAGYPPARLTSTAIQKPPRSIRSYVWQENVHSIT
jgi:hypothetical protein